MKVWGQFTPMLEFLPGAKFGTDLSSSLHVLSNEEKDPKND